MKWMLVVLVGGITPVNTDLIFEKFSDCLAAEEQMRRHYADAFEAWDRSAASTFDRRRDYAWARDLQAKRLLSNSGTCVPHGSGGDRGSDCKLTAADRPAADKPAVHKPAGNRAAHDPINERFLHCAL